MPLTVMTSPTIVFPPSEPVPPRSRRAIALEHRRQNILTMRYRSSNSSLRENAAKQPESTPPPVGVTRAEAPKKRARTTNLSCASYRLQSVDIDNWLKESMPLPPDYEHDPMPTTGLGIAMFGHVAQQDQYKEMEHITPLLPRAKNHNESAESRNYSTPHALAQAVKQLRLTDLSYPDYRASDAIRSSYYSTSSTELDNWPLVST